MSDAETAASGLLGLIVDTSGRAVFHSQHLLDDGICSAAAPSTKDIRGDEDMSDRWTRDHNTNLAKSTTAFTQRGEKLRPLMSR